MLPPELGPKSENENPFFKRAWREVDNAIRQHGTRPVIMNRFGIPRSQPFNQVQHEQLWLAYCEEATKLVDEGMWEIADPCAREIVTSRLADELRRAAQPDQIAE